MKQYILLFFALALTVSCKKTVENTTDETSKIVNSEVADEVQNEVQEVEPSVASLKEEITAKGFETFDYVDAKTKDTILMQKYFMVFLKKGPIRTQNEQVIKELQEDHLEHLSRMYEEGYADLIGPFGDDGDIRGIAVYNVPTLKMADSLAKLDPMVKSGNLEIEVHPWWTAKGQSLR